MKIVLYILGILNVVGGTIFILQGINILPGSFMSGNPQWAVNGAVAIVIGLVLIFLARKQD